MNKRLKPLFQNYLNYDVRFIDNYNMNDAYLLCKGNTIYYSYLKEEATLEEIKYIMTELPPNVSMDNKYFVGLYDNDKMIALLDLIDGYPNKDAAFIGLFIISIEYQGKGIGTDIINRIFNMLKSLNFNTCHLGVIDTNLEAINFWRKLGFEMNGTINKHEKYNVLMMDKLL